MKWRHRLKHWGWIKRDGRRVGVIAGGLVACLDDVLPPQSEAGYPVVEGATKPLTIHSDARPLLQGQAGGLRLRVPPVAERRTQSVFLGVMDRRMWNSPYSRLTTEGRSARRLRRARRSAPERYDGYEVSEYRKSVHASDFQRDPAGG